MSGPVRAATPIVVCTLIGSAIGFYVSEQLAQRYRVRVDDLHVRIFFYFRQVLLNTLMDALLP